MDNPLPSPALSASTPGRICLFGEHQDYLGLPVIAAALDLRIRISGTPTSEPRALLRMPDISEEDTIPLDKDLPYRHQKDFLRAAVHVLRREGFTFSHGLDAEVKGDIPINSGTSSSSALIVSWISYLAQISDQKTTLDPLRAAALAYRTEVVEFSAPGGMMDHYSTACGGVIYLETDTHIVEQLHPRLGSFVLADSGEQKDTTGILARVKDGVLSISRTLTEADPSATLGSVSMDDVERFKDRLTPDEISLLEATIANRDITQQGLRLLREEEIDDTALGKLLHRHQSYLRDPLRISTPKIDAMIQSAYDAGALGAKINGSGGGGCMFAYAPDDPDAVREALSSYGRAWIVTIGEGLRIEADDHSV